jgi:hypothetical protein
VARGVTTSTAKAFDRCWPLVSVTQPADRVKLSVQRLSRLRGKTAALLARVYVSRRSNVLILRAGAQAATAIGSAKGVVKSLRQACLVQLVPRLRVTTHLRSATTTHHFTTHTRTCGAQWSATHGRQTSFCDEQFCASEVGIRLRSN